MPDLVYRVKWEIDEPPDMSSAQTVGGTGGADMGDVYQQNINNSKTYQAVIKNELNLTIQNTQAQQDRRRQISSLSKDTRDLVSVIKDEIAAVRATTAEMKLQDNVSDEMIAGAIRQSSALRALAEDQRILAIAADETHPAYRMMNQLLASVFNTIKASSNEVKNYGSQLYELSTSTDGLVSRELALTEAIKAKTDEVRRYNAIVEVRGAVDESEIALYQRATQELQDMREELVAVANASENIDSSQIREMNKALKGAGQAATSATRYLSGMAGQQAGVNRLGNNSNQIFLAFGDALQDSAQFSYGFATGMRAVGNNLTFAAEQFSYAYQRAGSMNELMKEFRKTITGPVGIVVGINAAVTVITMFSQMVENRLKEVREQGKSTSEVFLEIADSFASAVSETTTDPFGLVRAEAQLRFTKTQFESLNDPLKEYVDTINQMQAEWAELPFLEFLMYGPTTWSISFLANYLPSVNKGIIGFVTNLKAAFGDESARAAIEQSEAYKQLSLEIEKLELKQKSYTNYLNQAGNEALKSATEQFGKNSEAILKLSTNQIDIETATKRTVKQVQNLINELITLPSLTDSQILALSSLREEYVKLNSELQKYRDAQYELNKIEEKTKSVEADLLVLQSHRGTSQQIYNAEVAKAIAQREQDIVKNNELYASEKLRIENQLALGQLNEDQAKKQQTAIISLYAAQDILAEQQEANAIRQAELNKLISDTTNLQDVTNAISTLGEVFGASKDLQVAMAIIDGGAAIVKTFAQLGFPAGVPAAIAVAARTAKVIADMKKTNAGSKTPIGGGGTSKPKGISVETTTRSSFASPFTVPQYTPSNQMAKPVVSVTNELRADNEKLYILTKQGERRVRSKQL